MRQSGDPLACTFSGRIMLIPSNLLIDLSLTILPRSTSMFINSKSFYILIIVASLVKQSMEKFVPWLTLSVFSLAAGTGNGENLGD